MSYLPLVRRVRAKPCPLQVRTGLSQRNLWLTSMPTAPETFPSASVTGCSFAVSTSPVSVPLSGSPMVYTTETPSTGREPVWRHSTHRTGQVKVLGGRGVASSVVNGRGPVG